MKTSFLISALDNVYNHLFACTRQQLAAMGITKQYVDRKPGYPCRVSLEDAEIGEEVLLLSIGHHKVHGPYRSTGPIYIRRGAEKAVLREGEIPLMLRHRLLSLRAYDVQNMMIDATTCMGDDLETLIQKFFLQQSCDYIHIHNAGPGCYNCRVDRVSA